MTQRKGLFSFVSFREINTKDIPEVNMKLYLRLRDDRK